MRTLGSRSRVAAMISLPVRGPYVPRERTALTRTLASGSVASRRSTAYACSPSESPAADFARPRAISARVRWRPNAASRYGASIPLVISGVKLRSCERRRRLELNEIADTSGGAEPGDRIRGRPYHRRMTLGEIRTNRAHRNRTKLRGGEQQLNHRVVIDAPRPRAATIAERAGAPISPSAHAASRLTS